MLFMLFMVEMKEKTKKTYERVKRTMKKAKIIQQQPLPSIKLCMEIEISLFCERRERAFDSTKWKRKKKFFV